MISRLLTCALLAILTGACEPRDAQDGAAAPPAEPPEREEAPRLVAECANPEWGYRIAYPEGWRTNVGEVVPECSLFDPRPIEVAPATEIPYDIAVLVQREPVALERVAGEQLGRRVLTHEATSVAGRRAVRQEVESTGEGYLDRGIRSYEYVLELDGESLIMATHDLGELPYERKKRVLDAMAASLRFGGS